MRSVTLPSCCRISAILPVIFFCLSIDGSVDRETALASNARPDGEITVADIVDSWKKREKVIKNMKARILVHAFAKRADPRSGEGGASGPKQTFEISQEKLIFLDFANGRYRVEVKGGIYHGSLHRVVPRSDVYVFSNQELRDYKNRSESSQLHGVVRQTTAHEFLQLHLDTPSTNPLYWYVMPLGRSSDRAGLCSSDELRIIEKERVKGRELLKCQIGGRAHIWLDPNPPYLLVRRKTRASEANIEYEPKEGYGPVPTKWTYTFYQHGELRTATTCELREPVINTPMKASLFELEFPEKTVVQVLGPEENRTLLASKGGELVSKMEFERRNTPIWMRGGMWLLAANLLAVIVLSVFVFRRRLLRSS